MYGILVRIIVDSNTIIASWYNLISLILATSELQILTGFFGGTICLFCAIRSWIKSKKLFGWMFCIFCLVCFAVALLNLCISPEKMAEFWYKLKDIWLSAQDIRLVANIFGTVLFGVICTAEAREKGRNSLLWLLAGLIFEVFALIVICVLPEQNNRGVEIE